VALFGEDKVHQGQEARTPAGHGHRWRGGGLACSDPHAGPRRVVCL